MPDSKLQQYTGILEETQQKSAFMCKTYKGATEYKFKYNNIDDAIEYLKMKIHSETPASHELYAFLNNEKDPALIIRISQDGTLSIYNRNGIKAKERKKLLRFCFCYKLANEDTCYMSEMPQDSYAIDISDKTEDMIRGKIDDSPKGIFRQKLYSTLSVVKIEDEHYIDMEQFYSLFAGCSSLYPSKAEFLNMGHYDKSIYDPVNKEMTDAAKNKNYRYSAWEEKNITAYRQYSAQ